MDNYKCGLFHSLKATPVNSNPCVEGPTFFGFTCGNHFHPGCLTPDREVRLHSCEFESACPAVSSQDTIFITPIISRTALGESIAELGAGGGGGDLVQSREIELNDVESVMRLVDLCNKTIDDPDARSTALETITRALLSETKQLYLEAGSPNEGTNLGLEDLVQLLPSAKTAPEIQDVNSYTRQSSPMHKGFRPSDGFPRRIVSNIHYMQYR